MAEIVIHYHVNDLIVGVMGVACDINVFFCFFFLYIQKAYETCYQQDHHDNQYYINTYVQKK